MFLYRSAFSNVLFVLPYFDLGSFEFCIFFLTCLFWFSSPQDMQRCIVYCFLLVCWSCVQRNQRSSAADISYTGYQKGMKFGTSVVQALLYISAKIGEMWSRGSQSHWGARILKDVKKIVKLFSYIVWLSAMKFEGYWCVADLKGFWWTLVYFSSEHRFLIADVSHTSCQSVAKFSSARDLVIGHLFSEFDELWSGVLQYHVATCISHSLMHLFTWLFFVHLCIFSVFLVNSLLFWVHCRQHYNWLCVKTHL